MKTKVRVLKTGDTVAVIAPASPPKLANSEDIDKAKIAIEKLGFKVIMYPSCYARHGYLSGTDDIRAKDVNDAFSNKDVDGIICLSGGYGTPRILDMLDYDLIASNPKFFLGYSDITALHTVFNQKCNMVTHHGPMGRSDCFIGSDKANETTKSALDHALFSTKALGLVKDAGDMIAINKGIAQGEIIGGNLSLLVSTLGSPYEIDTKDKVLFIEEIGEHNYKIDRMLTSLRLAGKFKDCKAVLLGTWSQCGTEHDDKALKFEDILTEIVKPCGKPILCYFNAGHGSPNISIPFGTNVKIDADNLEVTFLESGSY